jgi:hypothetical protein
MNLTDETKSFVMKVFQSYVQVYCRVDGKGNLNIKEQASGLLGLAFSTVSQETFKLKSVGFDLV